MEDQQERREARDRMMREAERDEPPHSSAMVIVLGLVSLLSLAIGFVLGKIL